MRKGKKKEEVRAKLALIRHTAAAELAAREDVDVVAELIGGEAALPNPWSRPPLGTANMR